LWRNHPYLNDSLGSHNLLKLFQNSSSIALGAHKSIFGAQALQYFLFFLILLTVKLIELITGIPLLLRGAPPMGAGRFMLRQIINLCGAIPQKMLDTANNLDTLKDKELRGLFLLNLG
jgi:hypothetical protein